MLAEETRGLADGAGVDVTMIPGGDGDVVDLDAAIEAASPDLDRPPREPDDPACQPYTSGTTGRPKGVVLTHRNLLAAVENLTRAGLPVDADDSFLLVLPFFHIFALNGIMGPYLSRGATLHLQAEADPERMLAALDEHSITKFAGVPAMFTEMFRVYREDPDAYDLSALSDAICSGAPLAEAARREIQAAWSIPIYEGWGMTETAPSGTIEPVHGVHKTASCIGPPVPGVEIQLTDPETREPRVSAEQVRLAALGSADLDFEDEASVTGEIAIRGDNVFQGYYDRPEKNAEVFDEAGWFYTRDIARVDSDGYLWIVDRADDMIIAGGENIYPAEVEDALYEHPDVAEAAVVAAPHETKGEAPVAFVVLETGSDLTEEALRRFSLDHVATYAHPRRVFFVEELPRSATQKVQRFELEEAAADRLDGPLDPSEEL
jgi:long-chain acyl-CoA synthetase